MLGTTKRITAANSRDFGKAIAPFIDSKEKKRGKKDEKAKKKDEKAEGPAVCFDFVLWNSRTYMVECVALAFNQNRQDPLSVSGSFDRRCVGRLAWHG